MRSGSKPACKPSSVPGHVARAVAIHLGRRLPAASSDQPGGGTSSPRTGQAGSAPCSVLLQVRFTAAARSPGRRWALTPPFHPYRDDSLRGGMFLWHCLAGHPDWVLPSTPLCGARTFLEQAGLPAATRPAWTRPSGYRTMGRLSICTLLDIMV